MGVVPQPIQDVFIVIERNREINVLDWLLTFRLESSLIWPAKWSNIKILYLLTRYLPIIDVFIVMYHQFDPSLSVTACKATYESACWLAIFGIALAEIILTVRTWAVWRRTLRITIALTAMFLTILTSTIVVVSFQLRGSQRRFCWMIKRVPTQRHLV
ncbi:hypothetical protein NP233_g12253 [Leucocoprinus birnbaumii]|uniref:DUF6533 domain-containing protein n=1 Tax=Leucocoprinus birnbaumii TaxID=56174 RepID=A0AAD5VKG4_9AGAR|nr:hypothetical protein NP233_g12253 [Leucocoprinus birnbaumii]